MKLQHKALAIICALSVALVPRVALAGQVQATWVHESLAGNRTACGTTWTNSEMEVASKTHRCGTNLTLTNPTNGATINVVVTDYSPNSQLDLTRTAFSHLASPSVGRITVNVQQR